MTHAGLGVDNDAINAFVSKIEWTIIRLPPAMAALKERYFALILIVKEARQAVHTFTASEEGKELNRLVKKEERSKAIMTAQEIIELERLENLRLVLSNAREAERRANKESAQFAAAKTAVDNFTKSKDGKLRAKLVTKRNAQTANVQMSEEDVTRLKHLGEKLKDLQRSRDRLAKEKTDKYKKFEEDMKPIRKDKDGWFVRLDKIFSEAGAKREDYFKRQFSGRPLKVIKKNAKPIFANAKTLVLEYKDPSVEDSVVIKLCDDMTDLLQKSYRLFNVLHKESPDLTDVALAKVYRAQYMEKLRETAESVTPKAHCLEDHAITQFVLHMENGLTCVIEQFVERNHQVGSKVDQQCKRIPNTKNSDT
jgi:hypothetical protein